MLGFRGLFSRRCHDCRSYAVWSGDPDHDTAESRRQTESGRPFPSGSHTALRCPSCHRRLASAVILAGCVMLVCPQCRIETAFRSKDSAWKPSGYTADEIVALMDERWRKTRGAPRRSRASLAAGLRFDVLTRDGFRCRYCGVSVADGAVLHVDHVIPRSKGGTDRMDNLVTACFACNVGKSDKDVGDNESAI